MQSDSVRAPRLDTPRSFLPPGLLGLIERLLNRQIARSETAEARAVQLEGATLAVHASDLGRRILLRVGGARLSLTSDPEQAADAELAGTLPALLALFGSQPEAALRSGRISVHGDGQILDRFRRLLQVARPDWEEELAGVVGDVAAHRLGNAVRGLAGWGRRSVETLWQDLGEYLQEEGRDLPTRIEAEEFMDEVDRLRADVERLAARVARLESHRSGD